MRQVFQLVFITAFNVVLSVMQDINDNLVDHEDKMLESTLPSDIIPVTLETKIKFAHTEKGCHIGFSMCIHYHRDKQQKEVCAHHRNFQLLNFANLCEVYLQNCLYTIEKEANKPHVPDFFYYNRQEKNCQYYLKEGKTLEEAIRLYYLDGLKKDFLKNII